MSRQRFYTFTRFFIFLGLKFYTNILHFSSFEETDFMGVTPVRLPHPPFTRYMHMVKPRLHIPWNCILS